MKWFKLLSVPVYGTGLITTDAIRSTNMTNGLAEVNNTYFNDTLKNLDLLHNPAVFKDNITQSYLSDIGLGSTDLSIVGPQKSLPYYTWVNKILSQLNIGQKSSSNSYETNMMAAIKQVEEENRNSKELDGSELPNLFSEQNHHQITEKANENVYLSDENANNLHTARVQRSVNENSKCVELIYRGQLKEALEMCNMALALNPPKFTASTILYNKCVIFERMGRTAEALEACEQAIKLDDPSCPDIFQSQCIILYLKENLQEALAACDQSITHGKNFSAIFYNKCKILNHLGQVQEALLACNNAIQLQPTDPAPQEYIIGLTATTSPTEEPTPIIVKSTVPTADGSSTATTESARNFTILPPPKESNHNDSASSTMSIEAILGTIVFSTAAIATVVGVIKKFCDGKKNHFIPELALVELNLDNHLDKHLNNHEDISLTGVTVNGIDA